MLSRAIGLCAVIGMIKLAIDAGKANPAPPIGPALGSKVCSTSASCRIPKHGGGRAGVRVELRCRWCSRAPKHGSSGRSVVSALTLGV